MAERSRVPRLTDISEAIERIRDVLEDMPLEKFEADWQRQWLLERGVEIISETSRHLTDELNARHPNIPWRKAAGIGNVLRHNYQSIAAPVMWQLARTDLLPWKKPAARNSKPSNGTAIDGGESTPELLPVP